MSEPPITPNDLVNISPLDKSNNELLATIINETDPEKLKDLTHLFNINQTKKNIIRVNTMNKLIDKVADQMIERVENVPDEFSNKELVEYLKTAHEFIEDKKSYTIEEVPPIQVTQLNVNIEESPLSKESRAKITGAVEAILAKALSQSNNNEEEVIITPPSLLNEEGEEQNGINI